MEKNWSAKEYYVEKTKELLEKLSEEHAYLIYSVVSDLTRA